MTFEDPGARAPLQGLMMRYRIRPDELPLHLDLLRAVYDELAATGAGDLHWASYQLDDPTEFVEIAFSSSLPGPLPGLESFRRYRAGLDERCEERTATELREFGSYRMP
jgi:hypothetical protein